MEKRIFYFAKRTFSLLAICICFSAIYACSSDPAEDEITPTYSIGGTVTKSDGGAASGASVQLQNVVDGSYPGQTTTDATGTYAFSGLPAGTYKIVVTLNGYETAIIGNIELNSNASGKDAVLQKIVVPTYTISGVATKPDGSAAADVTVQLQTAADNTLVGQSVKTDATGAYTLTDIPAGAYSIIFTLEGYEAGVLTGVTVNNTNLTAQNITLQIITVSGNAISIVYAGNEATVGNLPADGSVTASKSGADITIASSSSGLVELNVSGSTSGGSLKIQNNATAPNIIRLTLSSAVIASASKLPPIQVTKNEGITIVELKGNNILSDNAANEENAALISKSGSLEFEGYGKLFISGAAKHAIASSKKDITVRSGDITVTSAASDGFHAEVGFLQSGGSLDITASGDGIDAGAGTAVISGGNINIVSTAEDVKGIKGDAGVSVNGGTIMMRISGAQSKGIGSKANVAINGGNISIETSGATVLEATGSGYDPSYCTAIKAGGTITVSSGAITINSLKTANGGKGLSADGDITITGGDINITTEGDGAVYTNETGAKDSYSAACIKSNANISLLGGTITCTSSGTAGKGISADGTLTIGAPGANDNALAIMAKTTGAKFLVSGSTSGGGGRPGQGGGMNNGDYANPKIIKSGGDLTINSGTLRLIGTTDGGEGLESKATLTINGGIIEAYTVDDCLNAATHIQINGGSIYCKATGNDGIDSNGTIEITGGTVIAQGSEEGLDCDSNPFVVKGGTIIGIGQTDMGSNPTTGTTQGFIKLTVAPSTQLGVKNAAGEWILLYQVPAAISGGMGGPGGSGSSLVLLLSSPKFEKGASYSFYSGGTITGGTTVNGYNTGGTYTGGTGKSLTVK